jgi:hypothetical protein
MQSVMSMLYSSSDGVLLLEQTEQDYWSGHLARLGDVKSAYRIVVREGGLREHFEDYG